MAVCFSRGGIITDAMLSVKGLLPASKLADGVLSGWAGLGCRGVAVGSPANGMWAGDENTVEKSGREKKNASEYLMGGGGGEG